MPDRLPNGGVGGVMKLPDQAKRMGTPPNWIMYVGTPSVDDTVMRIAQLGGRVHKQPEDIPNVGRFAVVQDPFGATFALLTPKPPPGAPERKHGGIGDFSWFELYTPNPDGARAAAAVALANGGKIVNGPMQVPGGDWIAQGIDPQGAMFAVHSLNPAAQQPAPKKAAPVKKVVKKKAAKKAAKRKK